jgi:hypothetical protein
LIHLDAGQLAQEAVVFLHELQQAGRKQTMTRAAERMARFFMGSSAYFSGMEFKV